MTARSTKTGRARSTAQKIRVMLVDDHPLWRETVRQVLEGSGVGRIVAEASDGPEAASMALEAQPEVVLMDMMLPTLSGIEATRQVQACCPSTRVLVLSSSQERNEVLRAVRAGASGYLVKSATAEEIADAVERVHAGELVLPAPLAGVVLDEFRKSPEQLLQESPPTVAVACDSVIDREGLVRLLGEAGIDVAASGSDPADVIAGMSPDIPDAVILVVREEDGLGLAEHVRSTYPRVGILVLSDNVRASSAFALLSDGSTGVGYILKDRVSELDELVDAVRRVSLGESVVDPEIIGGLVERRAARSGLDLLTERERSVLALMAEGRSNQAISDRLFLSSKTVEKYVRAIFSKLGLIEAPDDHRRVLAVLAYLRSA